MLLRVIIPLDRFLEERGKEKSKNFYRVSIYVNREKMTITQTFWLPVASGVVITLIVVLLKYLLGQLISMIGRWLTPRSVEGTWNTKFWKGAETFDEYAKVHQVLHYVWGKIAYPHKERTYDFRGTLRENVLVAAYEVKGQRSTIDRGAFTLVLTSGGNKMEGTYSWTDDDSRIPQGDKYEWYKQD